MLKFNFSTILLAVVAIAIVALIIYVISLKGKKEIHYFFALLLSSLLEWNICILLFEYVKLTSDNQLTLEFLNYLSYIGVCFTPVFLLLLGIVFAKSKVNYKFVIFTLVIPVITQIVIWTDHYHKLFFQSFSPNVSNSVYGKYFYIHAGYSYILLTIGFGYLIFFSIKNSGFFSRQALFIILGSMVSMVVNILYTFHIYRFSFDPTPASFFVAVLCYAFAIFKFDFLNIQPIAYQNIVDHISDSFVVVSDDFKVIEFNKAFLDNFGDFIRLKRKDNLIERIKEATVKIDADYLADMITNANQECRTIEFEYKLITPKSDKYFIIEVTPLRNKKKIIGTTLLLKDITQHKLDLEIIEKTQKQMIEQAKLQSVENFVGSMAHIIRTSLFSIKGTMGYLEDDLERFEDCQGLLRDSNMEGEFSETLDGLRNHIGIIDNHASNINKILNNVLDKIKEFKLCAEHREDTFTVKEFIGEINEYRSYNCNLNYNYEVDLGTKIRGSVHGFVNVIDCILMNAAQSYKASESKKVDLSVVEKESDIIFSVRDYGCGIDEETKKKIFVEFTSKKGKNGYGTALFFAKILIKAQFGGDMWFQSQINSGSTFYVSIPKVLVK